MAHIVCYIILYIIQCMPYTRCTIFTMYYILCIQYIPHTLYKYNTHTHTHIYHILYMHHTYYVPKCILFLLSIYTI